MQANNLTAYKFQIGIYIWKHYQSPMQHKNAKLQVKQNPEFAPCMQRDAGKSGFLKASSGLVVTRIKVLPMYTRGSTQWTYFIAFSLKHCIMIPETWRYDT